MTDPVVHIAQLTLQYADRLVLDKLDWQIHRGEHWLIGGKSGSGKSALAKAEAVLEKTTGNLRIHLDDQSALPERVLYVSNLYQFANLEGDRNFYYQQRYTKPQKNDTLTVYAELAAYADSEDLSFVELEQYLSLFEFVDLKGTQLIELSSGEHKKLQLIKALWLKPQLLIVDEPYTGLDKASRQKLNGFFDALADSGVPLVLVTNEPDLPSCINRFAEIDQGKLTHVDGVQAISMDVRRTKHPLPAFLKEAPALPSSTMVRMDNIQVRYGEKIVLNGIDWIVQAGETWLLQEPIGS